MMLAGAGSLAYFSDSETSEGNVFRAGTLELSIEMTGYEVNWDGHEPVDDPFSLDDVKPGDNGCFTYTLTLEGNPAYICAEIEATADSDDNIRDSLEFKIWWYDQEIDWFTWEEDNQVIGKSLGQMDPDENREVTICWRIPADVGNEIQGQNLDIVIRFKAEQVRHREDMIYGIAHADQYGLYRIYPTLGEVELIVEYPAEDGYRNALGYDLNLNRLYFSRGTAWPDASPELRYYDFATEAVVETGHDLVGPVYAAACRNGDYFYIPEETNNLRKITFDAAGDFVSDEIVILDVVDPEAFDQLAMGDIDFTLNGSVLIGSTTSFYFTHDMVTGDYQELTADRQYQLAFGPDGTLWANHHTEEQMYWIEDPLDLNVGSLEGKLVEAEEAGVGGDGYYDLAGWWPCQRNLE